MKLRQLESCQKRTSGKPLNSFLENLQIGKGDLVSYGWYYRNSPIESDPPTVLGVVLEDPVYAEYSYEKLTHRKKVWSVNDIEDFTLIAPVLTNDGITSYYPVYNLIKREDNE
jgi:hypothetical protein